MLMLILGESWIKSQALHLLSYSMNQWGWMVMIGTVNLIGLATITIAQQNERSGFTTLIGYVGLVYSFLGDWIIFREQLYLLQVCGIVIIVVMNVALVFNKMKT